MADQSAVDLAVPWVATKAGLLEPRQAGGKADLWVASMVGKLVFLPVVHLADLWELLAVVWMVDWLVV
jgi:hypothetical protein